MEKNYQKTTSYHNGAVSISVSGDTVIISKLAGKYPIADVVMTLTQARELLQILAEGIELLDQAAKVLPEWAMPGEQKGE